MRVEPPRLVPEDCDPEPPLGEGGFERTDGGGDEEDGRRGEVVRAGGVLFDLPPVFRDVLVDLPVDLPVDVDFFLPPLTAGDFPELAFDPEPPETDPRSRYILRLSLEEDFVPSFDVLVEDFVPRFDVLVEDPVDVLREVPDPLVVPPVEFTAGEPLPDDLPLDMPPVTTLPEAAGRSLISGDIPEPPDPLV